MNLSYHANPNGLNQLEMDHLTKEPLIEEHEISYVEKKSQSKKPNSVKTSTIKLKKKKKAPVEYKTQKQIVEEREKTIEEKVKDKHTNLTRFHNLLQVDNDKFH